MSKTFRKFPEIIVHPPENLTASMPDITEKFDLHPLINSTVNENNLSCPDLADETIYAAFTPLKPLKSFDSVSSSASYNDVFTLPKISRDTSSLCMRELGYLQKQLSQKQKNRRKLTTPRDFLKNKQKQSVSMHNLFVTPLKSYDNYHTIHSSSNLCCGYTDLTTVDVMRSNSFDVIENPHSNNTNKLINNEEIVYKCCCGMSRCKTVVPIQQYLETYFDKRVRFKRKKEKKRANWFFGAVVVVVACFI